MKSLNYFVILLCINLCTTNLLGNPWNTNYAGNPQIRLTKTAGTVTPRGGNVFSVEWTVVIQNTGDENNVEVTSWDDDFQLANAGSPMLIDFTKCKINSMTGTANGVAITIADANPLWNGSSANKKLMAANLSVTPLILDISEKITVKIFTQFTLALSTTIFNGTDATARWLNNGNYQPVPVVKNISDAGGLPTAPPLGTVTKSLVCYTLDPATDEHTLVYKLRLRNTGLIPLSEITLQDDLKNQIQGNVNVLSSEIVSTKVFNSTSGLAVADSTRYGLGNNGVFTGWNSNTANIYDTEVLTPQGATAPDLLVGESIDIVIRFVVKIAQTFVNSSSVRWIDQNHCALLNNRATLSIPSNSSLALATLQTYVCPLEITKTAVGGLTVLEIDTILGNRYSANWNFTLNKAPDLQINNISVKDNFEQSNPSPEAVEVLTSSITATSGFYILDAWDAETPYTSNDVLLTPNDYITNPNIGLDWLAGPYTESTGKYYNINVTYNTSFRYLFGTDPSATNTVPPASASICNKVEFSGDIINCNSDSIRITKMSQACVTLPSAPPQATVSKSLQCYTMDPLTDEHILVYNVRVRNTGLIPLSGINLQDDIKNQIQGNINVLSSEIISTKVINSTNGLAVLDSLRYGLGNNGVFTGWNSNTSNLFDTEVLIPSGTVAPILNIGESIDIILRFKVKIVQTFSNGSSIKWIDQNHCVLLNNKATLGIPLNPALSSASLSSYVCPISLVKTPFGAATVVSLDPVLGNTYSATWMIELNKSPDLAINNISIKDNFNLSNPFPEAIEILSTSYSNFEGFNPTDSWNGKTLYSATDIQTTPNEFMVNPNRGIDWQAGTVFTTNQLYSLMRFRAVTTFRYLYGTDPSATNTVIPELASICNHLELKGDIKACFDSIPLFISKDTCIALPVVPQMATMTNILKCYTIDQSSDIHTFRYNLRVTNTGLIPLSNINLQYNLENQIQGDINVLSSQIISTRVVTTSSGIGVSDSLRFGFGNNGVFTGWNSNSTNIFDTEVLASTGSSTPDLKVGESIDILIQFKVKIIQTFLNSASIRWIDQNHCVLLNGRAVLTSPLNPNLSTAQTPTYLCPIVAKKSLLGNISVVELDPVLGNKYLANWNVTFNKPPDLIISDISIRDNFELSNPFPEAVEMLSTTYGPYTGFFVRDEWDGESTYNSSNTMTTPNDYITNPNRGLDWLSGSAFETTGKFYKIDQTFTTNFRYLYGTDPSATNTVSPANALIENEARFTGTIAGCGDIPDQPIFISAKASVSPINVVPPGNSFVKQFKNLACNLDGSVTANYDIRFINTSNSGGLTQNYTYADFNITDNFDSVIAQNNYPFILSSASVISASKNGISQAVNSGFNASSNATIFANNLTLAPNDTAFASISIAFFPNGFNPSDFYLNEARANFSIQGFPNSGTYVTTIAGSVLGNACVGVNIVENVSNVQCNSNNTANDPTDDYITFTAMPTGLSGSYTITIPNGVTITPTTGTFGVMTNFRLHNGSANGTNYALTIVPISNPCCSKTFNIQSQNCCLISVDVTPLLQTTCLGDQLSNFTVTNNPNYKYTWYGPLTDTLNLGINIFGQITSTYLPPLSITSSVGIKYFAVVVEDMLNPTCMKDTVFMSVNVNVIPNVGLDVDLICVGGSVPSSIITAPLPLGGIWTQVGTLPSLAQISLNTISSLTESGIYKFLYTLNNCIDTLNINVPECVVDTFDLALIKKISSTGPITPGSTVDFEIKIFNQGSLTATNVNVTDYFPIGMTLQSPGTVWTAASGGKTNLVTSIPSIAPGDSVVRTISFTIDANFQGTTLRNWSEISSASNALNLLDIDSDPDTTNFNINGETDDLLDDNIINQNGRFGGDEDDHDPAEIMVQQTFDLALRKTEFIENGLIGEDENLENGFINIRFYLPGDTAKFTITVYNQGTLDATNINITDYIPNGMILSSPGIVWTNPISGTTNLVTPIPLLAAGTSQEITISLIVSDTFQGTTLRNWAEINGATNSLGYIDIDSDPDNDNFNQTGETDDLLDDNVIDQNGMTGGDEDDHDPHPIFIEQIFDLALRKKLSPSSVGPFTQGSTVSFDIVIYNQGTLNATNVNVTDYVPTGLTLLNPGTTWTAVSGGTTTLVSPISSLLAGDSIVQTITFIIDDNFQDTIIRNWSEISSGFNSLALVEFDSDPDNTNFNQSGETNDLLDDDVIDQYGRYGGDEDDHDPAQIRVQQTFDLALIKTMSTTGPLTPGSPVDFEIKIFNQGSLTATNVNVTDYLPIGMTLHNPGTVWTAPSGGKTNLVTSIPSIAPGDSVVRTISFTIDANFQGTTLRNWAEISAATNALNQADIDSDPDATNFNQTGETNDLNDDNVISQNGKTGGDEDDHDPVEITVSQVFDLALKKTLSSAGPFTPGSIVNFEIKIYNQGTITATNVNVTDYIPLGLTLNNPGATWTAAIGGKTNLVTAIPTLAPRDSVVRTISFTIDANFQGTTLRNWTEISAATNALNQPDIDSDPDATNFNQTGETNDLNDDNVVSQNGKTGGDEDDHDPAEITVSQTFDLALKKTLSSAGPFTPGSIVNFEIKIYNQGTITATNVNVTDYIPSGLTLNNPGTTWTTASDGKTNLVTAIPTLAPRDSVVRTISFTIDVNFQGTTFRNWAEISAATNALNQPDIDSDPDATNFNQTGETNDLNDDNVISQNGKTGGDEDDHDPAEITVLQSFIGFNVWKDKNGDGVQSIGELPLQGVIVSLYDCNTNALLRRDTTDQFGNYGFEALPGNKTYFVSFDARPLNMTNCNWTFKEKGTDKQTDSNVNLNGITDCIHLDWGERDSTVDAGFVELAAYGDYVWHDRDVDGQQESGEEGVGGVTVMLFDAVSNQVERTSLTDQFGYYFFDHLLPKQYYAKFSKPANFENTVSNQGSDLSDNDVDGTNGVGTNATTYLSPGETDRTWDYGIYKCSCISGDVWYDLNNDGIYQDLENGINGISVYLVDAMTNQVVASTVTRPKPNTPSDDGYYAFCNCVKPGMYYIKFDKPGDLAASQAFRGSNTKKYSHITHANGINTTNKITVLSGVEIKDINAGYQNEAIVGNFVWLDSNQNGLQDNGEKPVEGVRVMAINPAGTMVSESVTGSDGIYHLDGICEGDYYIKFKPQPMYSFTRPNLGNEDIDSDVNGSQGEGTTSILRINELANIQSIDAGLVIGVLPIEWIDFSGKFNGSFVELNWLTAAEKDNSHFIVERRNYSEVDFVEIGNVNSASTLNNSGSKYSFDDFDTESNGIYYYRIKQVDRSGKYSYSKVIAINKSTTNDLLVQLYPNPANNILHLDIQTTKETNLHFEITDIAGNNVLDQELIEIVKSGRHVIDINTSNFSNGNYIISIKSQQSISHHKFVISK